MSKFTFFTRLQQPKQQDEFNFLFVASAHVDQESCCMSLLIEQFDKGQMKFGSNSKFLMPTAPLPDAIYIPARLVYNHQNDLNQSQSMLITSNDDSSVAYYLNSIKFLVNYFQKLCTTLDSINKIMSISLSMQSNAVVSRVYFTKWHKQIYYECIFLKFFTFIYKFNFIYFK